MSVCLSSSARERMHGRSLPPSSSFFSLPSLLISQFFTNGIRYTSLKYNKSEEKCTTILSQLQGRMCKSDKQKRTWAETKRRRKKLHLKPQWAERERWEHWCEDRGLWVRDRERGRRRRNLYIILFFKPVPSSFPLPLPFSHSPLIVRQRPSPLDPSF